jgi:hypothetical protein
MNNKDKNEPMPTSFNMFSPQWVFDLLLFTESKATVIDNKPVRDSHTNMLVKSAGIEFTGDDFKIRAATYYTQNSKGKTVYKYGRIGLETWKLLYFLIIKATQVNNPKSACYQISFDWKEYADTIGKPFDGKQKDAFKINTRAQLNCIAGLTVEKAGMNFKIIQNFSSRAGIVTVNFDSTFIDLLRLGELKEVEKTENGKKVMRPKRTGNVQIALPRALFMANLTPAAFKLGAGMSKHYQMKMNVNNGINDRLRLETCARYLGIRSHDQISKDENGKTRGWGIIRDTTYNALESLYKADVLKGYDFKEGKGKTAVLTDSENEKYRNYHKWKEIRVYFEM